MFVHQYLMTILTRISKQKAWPFLMFVVGGAISMAGIVSWGTLFHPYVRVPGNVFCFI